MQNIALSQKNIAVAQNGIYLVRCCSCGGFKVFFFKRELWIRLPKAVVKKKMVSHGLCPRCFTRQLEKLQEL